MTHENRVTLSRAGRSWVAYFYDAAGKRCGKSLGLLKGHSKNGNRGINLRQARVLRDRLAVELRLNPVRGGKVPLLGDYLDRYLESRTDLKPGTKKLHDMTSRYLKAYFGDHIRIDRINRAAAGDWRTALAQGAIKSARLNEHSGRQLSSEATVCGHIRNAKVIFNRAVDEDVIPFNPFHRLKGTAPEPDKDWKYVNLGEFEKLLDACSNSGWRVFLGLQRLSGLRRGEALNLIWTAIDWNERRVTVTAEKTGKRRVVPIELRLHELLLEAFEAAEEGEKYVVPKGMVSRSSIRNRFLSIIERAGLPQWEDLFQVLRRNAETDWAQHYPQYVVSRWMGHDITVSDQHYLQVPEELYKKVAFGTDRESKTPPDVRDRTEGRGQLQNNCKTGSDVDGGEDAQVLVNTESGRRDSNPQHSAWKAECC